MVDGGYAPGGLHTLRILGFPAPGAVRNRTGHLLDQSYLHEFEVRDAQVGERAFLDFSPNHCDSIQFVGRYDGRLHHVKAGDGLTLECGEPLDPRSLRAEDFRIIQHAYSPRKGEPAEQVYSEVRAVIAKNTHASLVGQFEAAARIEIFPKRALALDLKYYYSLRVSAEVALADFSGHSPWPKVAGPGHAARTRATADYAFRLVPAGAHDQNHLRLDFVDEGHLSSQRIPWSDGEVSWEPGRLTLHCPREVGLGVAGEVHGSDAVHRAVKLQETYDLQATQLTIGEGDQLSVGQGDHKSPLCLLRSQTLLHCEGALVRSGVDEEIPLPDRWLADHRGASLGDLLAHARDTGMPWTVMIAGGDLILDGTIDVATPLLLVAGGRVRITGTRVDRGYPIYVVGDGGGTASVTKLPLQMEAPGLNPLRKALVGASVTKILPSWVKERYEWESLELHMVSGHGTVQVSFLPAEGPISEDRLVNHPRLLPPDSPLRIVVSLTMPPGGMWDPPILDSIEFSWKD